MQGRRIVKLIKPIVTVLSKVFSFFPLLFKEMIYNLTMFIPTKLGVLIRLVVIKGIIKCGDNIYIATNVRIKNFEGLLIGDNVSFHENCYIDAIGGIEIKDDVSIAHNCSIVSFEHDWSDDKVSIKYNKLKKKGIFINSDVWVGCGSRILAGAYVDSRVIIAAGSVVKGDLNSNCIYAGVPAKEIKKI